MTEEVKPEAMQVEEQEEGEILEDGEIADDEDDIVAPGQQNGAGPGPNNEKENKEISNLTSFAGTFSSYYMDREDNFKPNKRRKKNNTKKRKRSNSVEAKRKIGDQNVVDISGCLFDTSFDSVELNDEEDYNFDMLDFDVILEILGCTASQDLIDAIKPEEKSLLLLRIVKIMKQLHGTDPDTSRRFARLKRRTKERTNSTSIPEPPPPPPVVRPPVYKAICKFYMDGKCHKGSDCNFSHDCVVPKRKELCKFYLQGFCGKGELCLFMHKEFPCKFHHTNTHCYAGPECRFSHAPLTDETRDILRNYLDSGVLPDDPKPFRPNFSAEWPANKQSPTGFDVNGDVIADSPELDSSFNIETEQLLAKTRPVILGDPKPKMRTHYNTWKWQQELKELEKAYTGLKKNLFLINEAFAITDKPPTPRIEDDEEEIEAQILNYYNDMLDTDEMDEMMAVQEIENHMKQVKEEEEANKGKEVPSQVVSNDDSHTLPQPQPVEAVEADNEEISEEERRLIEASAHDEDYRIRPGMPNPFLANPPVINPVFDQPANYVPNTNFFPPPPAAADPFGHQISALDVSNMVRQIRNGAVPEPPNSAAVVQPLPPPTSAAHIVPVKPEIRDPRLNRSKDPRTQPPLAPPPQTQTQPLEALQSLQPDENGLAKPIIKVCNPNLIVEYKLFPAKLSAIDYSPYNDLYLNDLSAKNDPRLKKYFSDPKPPISNAVNNSFSTPLLKSRPQENFVPSVPLDSLDHSENENELIIAISSEEPEDNRDGEPPSSNGLVSVGNC